MAGPSWNTRPEEYCKRAKAKAVAAFHGKYKGGLTALERAYLKSIEEGRLPAKDPSKDMPYYEPL